MRFRRLVRSLGPFYYRRAQARAALGRTEDAIADCQQALAHGGNLAAGSPATLSS